MARKKKETKKIETTQTPINTEAQSLKYQGKIKLQVLHGNKVISTKDYSNNGLPSLFKYLSYALAGQYYESLRPRKICIFKCQSEGDLSNPINFNWDNVYNTNQLQTASPFVAYDATPIIKKNNSNGYSTTFRFKVPFNWLYLKEFNVMGLFTENNEACAYYLFTKQTSKIGEDGKELTDSAWDNQKLDDITGNFSLIIEWTMEISNK